ncbi:carbonic anhydrase [Castellaniella sp. GW247-6E4]|uniref:carbonic anhydrase n=1 Tax=Castellaniella sp. GW247-6E4 TaxID=3140380 RepID=UPI0033147B71
MRLSTLLAAGLVLCVNATWAAGPAQWGYGGAQGPAHWGGLSPDFTVCEQGRNQSPIDIRSAVTAKLPPLRTHYTSGPATIVNNGHTIQVNFAPGGILGLDGEDFELKQVHFHAPSENTIDGRSFPFEAHFVHADAKGALAVIGVMYETGAANEALAPIWAELPGQAGPVRALSQAVDAARLLPATMGYYRYSGSLTTPPCSEGVRWLVLKTPLTVSAEQVAAFERIMGGPTNRPVQPLNGRLIAE